MTNTDSLIFALIQYASNDISSSDIADMLNLSDDIRVANILTDFQSDWDQCECDDEGATKEQDKAMDALLEATAKELLALKNNQFPKKNIY